MTLCDLQWHLKRHTELPDTAASKIFEHRHEIRFLRLKRVKNNKGYIIDIGTPERIMFLSGMGFLKDFGAAMTAFDVVSAYLREYGEFDVILDDVLPENV